ncbi:MAG TPA: signal peptidase I [Anaerolineales bacterium]
MDNFHSETIPDPEPLPSDGSSAGWRRFLLDMLETVVLAVILFVGINQVSARIRVESISMQPTLYAGDFVIVNKLAYKIGIPGRGDVIVFHYPPDPSVEPYIKRVIGLPGETVKVDNGKVYVNGVPLREPYIKALPAYNNSWVVPADSLFVLGDNRNNSSDSHSWGFVPIGNVIGKAEVVYWPPSQWQVFNQPTAAAAEP